ncbi:hypothetical protein C0992_001211, partial [Termitomyces sp. T32_za158]
MREKTTSTGHVGEITYSSNGSFVTRGIAPAAKTTETTLVPQIIQSGNNGAVFLRLEVLEGHFQGPYSTMSEVTSFNDLPDNEHVSPDARAASLPFVKVETLDWANNG